MSTNREEILGEFQAWTGITDVAEALMWLDNSEWDLQVAINNAIPPSGSSANTSKATEDVRENNDKGNGDSSQASTSSTPRILEIQVHYKSHVYRYQVPETMTVECLKTLISSDTQVNPADQHITGWTTIPLADEVTLASLNMPEKRFLFLNSTRDSDNAMDIDESNGFNLLGMSEPNTSRSEPNTSYSRSEKVIKERVNPDRPFCLKVYDTVHKKDHYMRISGTQTIAHVKKEAAELTGIPPWQQNWHGWPGEVEDSTKLHEIPLKRPYHNLKVERKRDYSLRNGTSRSMVPADFEVIDSDENSEASDDFEDASEDLGDDIFNEETPRPNGLTPLIPDNVEDETVGSVLFIDGYVRRYGQTSPNFYSGSLEDAVKLAFNQPSREKRMLAIYLHHDRSVLTNVFCSMLLGSEAVLETLGNYFVIWGWDITNRRNREMLLNSVGKNLGRTATETVESIKSDNFPVLLIFSRARATTELQNVIHGNIGVNELLATLIRAVGIFIDRRESEIKEEEERAERDRIKFEQDRAYQESLQMDKAKEEALRQQALLKTQEEERLRREEEQREAEKLAVESNLPPEPVTDTPQDQVMTFRFRTPSRELLARKFFTSDKLQIVFDFLLVKGFRVDEFKVISPFPTRRDLSTLDGNSLLSTLGLCAQETFILEEK